MNNLLLNPFDLSNRNIWLIGGAGYLGRSTTFLLESLGAKILCIDLDNRAEKFVKENKFGSRVLGKQLDISNGNRIKEFAQKEMEECGVPDGVVNFSFGSTSKSFESLTEEEFDKVNHDGLTNTFILTREIGQEMVKKKKRKPSVVLEYVRLSGALSTGL